MKKQKEVSQKHRKIHVGIAGIKSRRRKRSEKFEMHKQWSEEGIWKKIEIEKWNEDLRGIGIWETVGKAT